MKCFVAKFVWWLLLPEQEERRAAVAGDLIQTVTDELDFLKKVVTRDEPWVCSYELETGAQSSQWKSPGSPCLKRAQQSHSQIRPWQLCFLLGQVLSITRTPFQARQLVRSPTCVFCRLRCGTYSTEGRGCGSC